MFKKQLTGIIIAVVLVGLLFSLPKVVVESEEREAEPVAQEAIASNRTTSGQEEHDEHDGHDHDGHDHEHEAGMHLSQLNPEDRQIAERLQEKIQKSENKEKSAIFADSLAVLYAHAMKYDSAAYYAEQALTLHKTLPRTLQAGAFSSEAFKYSVEAPQQKLFAQKAEKHLTEVLGQQPNNIEAKNKLAMVYVASENPMRGIRLLQEVLNEQPDNAEALFNMGLLSVQSKQFDKAVERFERYTELEPKNVQGQFYLAFSYLQVGRRAEAKSRFQQVKELDRNPEVQAAVDQYLKDL